MTAEFPLDDCTTMEQIALWFASLPQWRLRLLELKLYILSLDDDGCYVTNNNGIKRITGPDLVDSLGQYERSAMGLPRTAQIPPSHRKLLQHIMLDVWDFHDNYSDSPLFI